MSCPLQTAKVRQLRSQLAKNSITRAQYEAGIDQYIAYAIGMQVTQRQSKSTAAVVLVYTPNHEARQDGIMYSNRAAKYYGMNGNLMISRCAAFTSHHLQGGSAEERNCFLVAFNALPARSSGGTFLCFACAQMTHKTCSTPHAAKCTLCQLARSGDESVLLAKKPCADRK